MAGVALLLFVACAARTASADTASPPAKVDIVYLSLAVKRPPPLLYLDEPPTDEGVAGARLAIADNNTTGQFTGQSFDLHEVAAPSPDAAVASFKSLLASGDKFFVADLPAATLDTIADLGKPAGATIFNATNEDDALRGPDCRSNLLHLLPSRLMLADALMQFLVFKQWTHIMLVTGPKPEDKAYADALRKSAKKFLVHIVSDQPWPYPPGARRTDTGFITTGKNVADFTQGTDYDVLVVADEAGSFGGDFAYRTSEPRPVAGSAGMVPSAWARPFQAWGATQLQSRFQRLAKRWMTDRDYGAWLAVRAVGEAATRSQSTDAQKMTAYLHGKDFELAGFKGSTLTFRNWDGQLRQPVLLADADALISVSPQQGFLHESTPLDTLGTDQPETTCHMN
jgi:ABC transporter substrate binding protein (PQQ-dependent alcohol dehydrogenase system)